MSTRSGGDSAVKSAKVAASVDDGIVPPPSAASSAPTPQAVAQMVARAKKALDEIEQEYRWYYVVVYGSAGAGFGTGGRTHPRESDSTGRQALAAADRSGMVRQTGALITRLSLVATAQARRLRSRPEAVERPDLYPALISPTEYERLVEAKARREQRGEGWGRG